MQKKKLPTKYWKFKTCNEIQKTGTSYLTEVQQLKYSYTSASAILAPHNFLTNMVMRKNIKTTSATLCPSHFKKSHSIQYILQAYTTSSTSFTAQLLHTSFHDRFKTSSSLPNRLSKVEILPSLSIETKDNIQCLLTPIKLPRQLVLLSQFTFICP